jgi:hypothetical protein
MACEEGQARRSSSAGGGGFRVWAARIMFAAAVAPLLAVWGWLVVPVTGAAQAAPVTGPGAAQTQGRSSKVALPAALGA